MKLINSVRAGRILRVSPATIRGMVTRGELKDHATTPEGKTKHQVRVSMAEVQRLKPAPARRGVWTHTTAPEQQMPAAPHTPAASGILTRLRQVESKVDQLLKIWS